MWPWQERRPPRFPMKTLLLERLATATPTTEGSTEDVFHFKTMIALTFKITVSYACSYFVFSILPSASRWVNPPASSHLLPRIQENMAEAGQYSLELKFRWELQLIVDENFLNNWIFSSWNVRKQYKLWVLFLQMMLIVESDNNNNILHEKCENINFTTMNWSMWN